MYEIVTQYRQRLARHSQRTWPIVVVIVAPRLSRGSGHKLKPRSPGPVLCEAVPARWV